MVSDEMCVLRALRLKGRVSADGLASATGIDAADAERIASDLVSAGELREANGNFMLLPAGRDRLTTLLEEERTMIDAHAMAEVYEDFVAVNGDFKQLASDWQVRDADTPNDHTDASYDQSVLDRLPGVDERVRPILHRAVALAPRLAPYQARFASALEKVRAGDSTWLLRPLIDSYHTVWFELHEELIGLSGLSREAEATSGRAE